MKGNDFLSDLNILNYDYSFTLRTIKGDAVEDYHMDSPTFDHDPIKVHKFFS